MKRLKVARDIGVYVPDLNKHGVPGSELPIWEYRRKVDPNWVPGPDYPAVVAEPLPAKKAELATDAIRERMEFLFPQAKNPIIQVVSHQSSVDLREYQTSRWVNAVHFKGEIVENGHYEPLPLDQHKPCGPASSLFLNTVHQCFSYHYPLGIRPDALMWMVLHEIGICVKLNSETYRHLFTDSDEKKLIDIQVNEIDLSSYNQANEWADGIQLLLQRLRLQMPSELLDYLLPSISTHDVASLTASHVAVLDAATPFYNMVMRVCCGIPSIRLFGEAKDYYNILAACTVLSEIFSEHLGEYFKYLLPVLQEIADTVAGRIEPDNDFWSSIYNHYSGSGIDDMDGWITAFVNYKFLSGTPRPKESHLYNWKENLKKSKGSYGRGIHREDIPGHLSSVPFVLNYAKNHSFGASGEFAGQNLKQANAGNGINFDCRLVAGFMAVEDIDGFATPTLGYAVIRGDQLETQVSKDQWSVQPEGLDKVTAPKKSVYGS